MLVQLTESAKIFWVEIFSWRSNPVHQVIGQPARNQLCGEGPEGPSEQQSAAGEGLVKGKKDD